MLTAQVLDKVLTIEARLEKLNASLNPYRPADVPKLKDTHALIIDILGAVRDLKYDCQDELSNIAIDFAAEHGIDYTQLYGRA